MTEADVDKGKVVDTATARGTDPRGTVGPTSDPSTVVEAHRGRHHSCVDRHDQHDLRALRPPPWPLRAPPLRPSLPQRPGTDRDRPRSLDRTSGALSWGMAGVAVAAGGAGLVGARRRRHGGHGHSRFRQ